MVRKSKANVLDAPFQGRWRIAEMELWDNDALDLVKPAFIDIAGQEGEMRFIAVRAWLDIRYTAYGGGPRTEFSWEGVDGRRSALRTRLAGNRHCRSPRRPQILSHG
jgi:hypothetical protein